MYSPGVAAHSFYLPHSSPTLICTERPLQDQHRRTTPGLTFHIFSATLYKNAYVQH